MNIKAILRWTLLTIVLGSVTFYAVRKSQTPHEPTAETAAGQAFPSEQAVRAAKVVVTYFTTDVRCDSCRTIEKLSREAIEAGFADELASGEVIFRVLNTDRPENLHFVEDYEIANKTVIVSHQQDGTESEWTNRQDVWLLFEEPDEFFSYVQEPVQRYLGKP